VCPGFWINRRTPTSRPSSQTGSMTYPFSSSSRTTAAGKSIPSACSSAKRPAGRRLAQSPSQPVLLDVGERHRRIVALQRGCGARASRGGRRALAFSGSAVFSHPRERDDVGDTVIHAAAGAQASSGSTKGRNDGLDNQLDRLVRGLLAVDAERVRRLGYRRARLTIRRRARVDNDLSSTGAPHGPVATGRLFGSTAASPPSRLARCAISPTSVAALTRWMARAGVASVACCSPWRRGQSGCLEPLAPTCNAGVTVV
jgi:hypothetical protein